MADITEQCTVWELPEMKLTQSPKGEEVPKTIEERVAELERKMELVEKHIGRLE